MTGPHDDQPVLEAGAPLERARAAVVLVHGRGATARGILGLGAEVAGDDVALLAPQAAGGTWYPTSFLAPLEANQPGLDSGIRAVMRAVERAESAGLARGRIVLGGFSQGACLATEVAARHAGRWGGVFAFSGGLIGSGPGPEGAPPVRGMGGAYPEKAFDYEGDFAGTPVFVGCSDVDAHIPLARVEVTAATFRRLGADVDARVYPGLGHTVIQDEVEAVRAMIAGVGLEG